MRTFSPRTLVRRARALLLAGRPTPYSAPEVRALLAPDADDATARRAEVLAAAAVPAQWVDRVREQDRWELGRLTERLPTVVFLYTSGVGLEAIGRKIGGWGAWGAGRALDAACGCIAERLNDRHVPGIRG